MPKHQCIASRAWQADAVLLFYNVCTPIRLQADESAEHHPAHISLSRTLYTTAQQRQSLVSAMQRNFKRQKRCIL